MVTEDCCPYWPIREQYCFKTDQPQIRTLHIIYLLRYWSAMTHHIIIILYYNYHTYLKYLIPYFTVHHHSDHAEIQSCSYQQIAMMHFFCDCLYSWPGHHLWPRFWQRKLYWYNIRQLIFNQDRWQNFLELKGWLKPYKDERPVSTNQTS